jgi:hypothetical protein
MLYHLNRGRKGRRGMKRRRGRARRAQDMTSAAGLCQSRRTTLAEVTTSLPPPRHIPQIS